MTESNIPIEEYTEEELEIIKKKEKAQRCKVIALHKMGHHPINVNVSNFNQKSKLKVFELVKELFDKPDDEIIAEFNDVCLEVVFDEKNDIQTYPIYSTAKTKPLPINEPVIQDIAGNIINR